MDRVNRYNPFPLGPAMSAALKIAKSMPLGIAIIVIIVAGIVPCGRP
ncbi:MAG: hypothetical protein GXP26_08940 [Planctomycetes bacterium]|nr:hypothetical protein [Planctomycetota bacterium]